MATWNITTPIIGAQPIATKDTTQRHPLGTIIQAKDATLGQAEFIYLKGVASTAVGSWVGYSPATGASVLAVANGTYPLAVSMTTNTTTTSYAWYQISGTANALGLTSITHSSGFLALTGTAGSLDDASVIVVGTFLDQYTIARPFSTNVVTVRN
jgi:hypothetical protein